MMMVSRGNYPKMALTSPGCIAMSESIPQRMENVRGESSPNGVISMYSGSGQWIVMIQMDSFAQFYRDISTINHINLQLHTSHN